MIKFRKADFTKQIGLFKLEFENLPGFDFSITY